MQTNPKLWLIELLAWWEGKVRPSQLALFGAVRGKARWAHAGCGLSEKL